MVDNWSNYRGGTSGAVQGWWDRQNNGTTTTTSTNGTQVRTDSSSWRQRGDRTRSSRWRSSDSDGMTTTRSSRSDRSDRATARSDRSDRASTRATRAAERGITRVEREKD